MDDYIFDCAAKRPRKRAKKKKKTTCASENEGLSNTCRQIISLKCKLIVVYVLSKKLFNECKTNRKLKKKKEEESLNYFSFFCNSFWQQPHFIIPFTNSFLRLINFFSFLTLYFQSFISTSHQSINLSMIEKTTIACTVLNLMFVVITYAHLETKWTRRIRN